MVQTSLSAPPSSPQSWKANSATNCPWVRTVAMGKKMSWCCFLTTMKTCLSKYLLKRTILTDHQIGRLTLAQRLKLFKVGKQRFKLIRCLLTLALAEEFTLWKVSRGWQQQKTSSRCRWRRRNVRRSCMRIAGQGNSLKSAIVFLGNFRGFR